MAKRGAPARAFCLARAKHLLQPCALTLIMTQMLMQRSQHIVSQTNTEALVLMCKIITCHFALDQKWNGPKKEI
jgi:hypothetical protein